MIAGDVTAHVADMRRSLKRCAGVDIVAPSLNAEEAARAVFASPCAVLAHDAGGRFTYANRTALRLFEAEWDALRGVSTTVTVADGGDAEERLRMLERVRLRGFVDDYAGERVTATGRKIRVEGAVVWNVLDAGGAYRGQAALLCRWRYL